MNNIVDLKQPVQEVLEQQPELLSLLVELGFTPLKQAAMRQTLGKVTSIKKGAQMLGIPLEKVIQTLQWNGYEVEE